ncbi:MAG: DNA mismatch repair endonuclease MutL [Candidatus Omnitrophota bacterium]
MDNVKINVLSDEVIGKISAGEVVERPASVVKELVENSIDAGADSIEIEVQDAGQSLIRVADNGGGMEPEDAKLACRRHSTSKISEIDDLDNIRTLGFRGEALSSIAAVSQMDLISCAQPGASGVYVYLENGEILKIRPAGRVRGTTIEARNLFYNVPARRKFLKKESTELAEIVNMIGRFIISHPGIEFKLTQGERCLLHAPKDMHAIERIQLVLGGDISRGMVDLSCSDENYTITGYISRPSNTRKDKRAQVFFVNGRFVRSKVLSDAVYDAYRSMVERSRYPGAVLFLEVSPREVDVNVHPTKLQVKFRDERAVKNAVTGTIKKRFEELKQTAPGPQTSGTMSSDGFARANTSVETEAPEVPVFTGFSEVQNEFSYGKDLAAGSGGSVSAEGKGPAPRPAGAFFQLGGCYIVQIKPEGITITDPHAAHERILYEFFSKATENAPAEVQNLLFPVRIDLSAGESVIMEKTMESFRVLGFHIEPFGEKSFIVQAAPAILEDRDVKRVLYDVLTDLASCDLARVDLDDELVKLTSCRAAVKAGDVLSGREMSSLLDQLARCDLPFTCPHGRPVTLDITVDELEKRFRRK